MPVRVVCQRVQEATLTIYDVPIPSSIVSVNPQSAAVDATIHNGVILYVAFLNPCTEEDVLASVETLISTKIYSDDVVPQLSAQSSVSQAGVEEGNASKHALQDLVYVNVMIIPQASLGSKIKGKSTQSHALVQRVVGRSYYVLFCETMASRLGACGCAGGEVALVDERRGRAMVCGTFGEKQRLRMISDGPNSHFFDL